jgi:hypothetical protein
VIYIGEPVPGRSEIDQSSSRPQKRHNPVHQHEVAEVVRAELRLESIFGMIEWCRHDTDIGNDHIEGLTLLEQPVRASSHTL